MINSFRSHSPVTGSILFITPREILLIHIKLKKHKTSTINTIMWVTQFFTCYSFKWVNPWFAPSTFFSGVLRINKSIISRGISFLVNDNWVIFNLRITCLNTVWNQRWRIYAIMTCAIMHYLTNKSRLRATTIKIC